MPSPLPDPAPAASHADPEAAYRARQAAALAQAEQIAGRAGQVGLLRFAAFAALVLCGAAVYDGRGPLFLGLGALALLLFVALILYHGGLLQRLTRARLLAAVNRTGLRRLDGSFADQPPPPAPPQPPPYAADLDLHGPASLAALIDTTQTRYGAVALWRSLSAAAEPPPLQQTRARQEAVRELAPLLSLRQAVEVAGRAMHGEQPTTGAPRPPGGREPNPEPLLRWAEGPPSLRHLKPLRALLFLPCLTVPLFVLALSLPSTPPLLGRALLVAVAAHGLILLWSSARISQLLQRVASSEASLSAYGEMLTLIVEAPLQAPENRALQARLRDEGQVTPERALHALRGTYGMLEVRQNPLAWIPLNFLLLWDVFFALRLERWQERHGPRLRGWLEALGEFEARASLAHLAHDNPDWAWPELVDNRGAAAALAIDNRGAAAALAIEPPRARGQAQGEGDLRGAGGDPRGAEHQWLWAEALGHPLLPRGQRVGNDVCLPGPGRALLVTGSNMSGKSTLLRALGLMQVLAQAGAPVCARRARLARLVLRTVVRVDDSLARGLSHFYAELRRLKEVIDAAGQPQAPLLYLLDEILHGTNTRERELGARLTIRTLCQRGALGVVTTHDLSLASLEVETAGAVQNHHFTELVEDGVMRFDYLLRPGPVRSSNALRLMRACGIDLDWSLLPPAAETAAPAGEAP